MPELALVWWERAFAGRPLAGLDLPGPVALAAKGAFGRLVPGQAHGQPRLRPESAQVRGRQR